MTQLCAIPGCRILGRHLPDCDLDGCRGCLPRATEDLVCDRCAGWRAEDLAEIAACAVDAQAVAYGLAGRTRGGGSGKPGSRTPGNDDAREALEDINNRLTTLAREIADVRGFQEPLGGPGVSGTTQAASKWLHGQMAWLRGALDEQGGVYAVAVFAEIRDCASRLRGLIDGPGAQRYLGPCGAPLLIEGIDEPWPCDGDVYGRAGAANGTCRTCGATVDQGERRAWLDDEVRRHAFRASEIAGAYGINVNTIRSWAARGLLLEHGRDRDDRPLYGVGDVLDLAAAAAARREENRARRARRKESEEVA